LDGRICKAFAREEIGHKDFDSSRSMPARLMPASSAPR
jgi:hypothetical protein